MARRHLRWLLLAIIWIASAAYMAPRMRTGWISFDDGTLAHSAERAMAGELPHRDFDELYTGGLDYVHAAAFHAFGVSLASLRTALLIAFLLWVPAVYYVASRFAPPVGAGAATLLALALSVPEYPASMPSWYNLFLATFGSAALLRFIDTRHRRWLFVAGLCGGASILIKVIGLYFVAAALLFVVFWEQGAVPPGDGAERRRDRGYLGFLASSLAAFVAVLLLLVWRRLTPTDLFYFVAPGAAIALVLLRRERRLHPAASVTTVSRLANLASLLAPLLLGVALPVALFLVPYARSGAVADFVYGVFVKPQQRLTFAGRHPPPLFTVIVALPFVLHLGFLPRFAPWASRGRWLLAALLATTLLAASHTTIYFGVWLTMFPLVPLAVFAGAWMLDSEPERLTARRQGELFALISVTAVCALVQYPFSDATYLCYVAPLAVLAVLGIVRSQRSPSRMDAALVLAFYLLFAVVRVHPEMVWRLTDPQNRPTERATLSFDRGGGLVVRRAEAEQYTRLVSALRAHGGAGGYTYATPDCPEVYFLSGLRNPTRTIFEFFDDPRDRTTRILHALDEHDVRVVAINQHPNFSGTLAPALDSAIAARYPSSETIGAFVVRWRN